jgi:two-component system response regulator GlrR
VIGTSPAFLAAVRLIERIARNDAPVLIEGETGTGKELAARAIHYGGARRNRPFVPVNCGAIPDSLVENELFGHRRGAYTDAKSEQAGVIAHAQHGTLFLDEVDALTPKAQVSLLRFLQDQHYRPLGDSRTSSADVRIISASNLNLASLTERGLFRLDLLFRLKVMHVTMPALRERRGDIALLAGHFLASCASRYGAGEKHLEAGTLASLERHGWPGNIRELENLICREYLLCDRDIVEVPAPSGSPPHAAAENLSALNFREAKTRAIAEFERRYLTDVLAAALGNVTKAANMVGKERRAFGRLLKKHAIDKSAFATAAPAHAAAMAAPGR